MSNVAVPNRNELDCGKHADQKWHYTNYISKSKRTTKKKEMKWNGIERKREKKKQQQTNCGEQQQNNDKQQEPNQMDRNEVNRSMREFKWN